MSFSAEKIISLLDYTSLKTSDTSETINSLCSQASTPKGKVAAVCIYPKFLKEAKLALRGSKIRLATVANFPQGTQKLAEVSDAIAHCIVRGANEVDVVMPYQKFLAGDEKACDAFIAHCKEVCGDTLLKVIIETGALDKANIIEEAAYQMCLAGADFIKTSTGFVPQGATPEAATAILKAIARYQEDEGRLVGLKISGGVRSKADAELYMNMAAEQFGEEYLEPETFRIGASKLLATLL